ncbi:hypothetical protein BKA61DRAFT_202668 [Leptodontidium sp. MPI-SDFR-AT-0119]|nr:hypothetical protein BKA61DRAFT_202668 [Leptodontidium sp. MPI-SDFR-AT-0119]
MLSPHRFSFKRWFALFHRLRSVFPVKGLSIDNSLRLFFFCCQKDQSRIIRNHSSPMNRPIPLPIPSTIAKTCKTGVLAFAPVTVPASTLKATTAQFSPAFREEFYGGIEKVGPGAAVFSGKPPTDCSSIQLLPLCRLLWAWMRPLSPSKAQSAASPHHASCPSQPPLPPRVDQTCSPSPP